MSQETFDVAKACEAQAKLCKEKAFPHFAPTNGVCWGCGRNIYEPQTVTHGERSYSVGSTVESAAKSLITGCPHCHRSYCD